MRRHRRNSFFKVGILCLALVVALGMMGVGYASWIDTASINGEVETGLISPVFTVTGSYYVPPDTTSVVGQVVGDTIQVIIGSANTTCNYYCMFTIQNTGTIPLDSFIDPLSVPQGVHASLINLVPGVQVDPAVTGSGIVHIYFADNTQMGKDFTVVLRVKPWNQ